MKLFKHVLAIIMPESLRVKTGAKEGDDYSWFEAEPGVFVLVEKTRLNDLARQGAVAALASKLAGAQTQARETQASETQAQREAPVVTRASEVSIVPQARAGARARESGGKNLIQELNSNGFLVISSEVDAKEASTRLEGEVKAGRVLGVRGFDKKYYVVTREFYDALSMKLSKALSGKREANISELSEFVKAPQEACIGVLYLMKEEGEVIERKRGFFTLVE